MWDLDDWWFRDPPGCTIVMLRTRSMLESRLWLEENEAAAPGFSLIVQAFRPSRHRLDVMRCLRTESFIIIRLSTLAMATIPPRSAVPLACPRDTAPWLVCHRVVVTAIISGGKLTEGRFTVESVSSPRVLLHSLSSTPFPAPRRRPPPCERSGAAPTPWRRRRAPAWRSRRRGTPVPAAARGGGAGGTRPPAAPAPSARRAGAAAARRTPRWLPPPPTARPGSGARRSRSRCLPPPRRWGWPSDSHLRFLLWEDVHAAGEAVAEVSLAGARRLRGAADPGQEGGEADPRL
jgi:hypothetical protein